MFEIMTVSSLCLFTFLSIRWLYLFKREEKFQKLRDDLYSLS